MDCGVCVAVQGQETSCSSSLITIRRMNNLDDFAVGMVLAIFQAHDFLYVDHRALFLGCD